MIVSSHHIYGMYDVHTEEEGNQEIVNIQQQKEDRNGNMRKTPVY